VHAERRHKERNATKRCFLCLLCLPEFASPSGIVRRVGHAWLMSGPRGARFGWTGCSRHFLSTVVPPGTPARPPAEITLFGFSLMVGKAIYKLQIEQLL